MSSNSDMKPQYFSNSDFERVAADIISSPRRIQQSSADSMDSLFRITVKQQEYYTKCFRHLIKTTQGDIDLEGALNGSDERIVAFFRRSSLDVPTLSKIWGLADVNEDGWLDLSEFSIAMHLVVLRVKGEVPIPDVLPLYARPPLQAVRRPRSNQESKSDADINATYVDKSQPTIKQFSKTPPLLVDSRPTAIKHAALLNLKSPSGPPPTPPNRPNQKGHNRSVSLDLKLVAQQMQASTIPDNHTNSNATTPIPIGSSRSDALSPSQLSLATKSSPTSSAFQSATPSKLTMVYKEKTKNTVETGSQTEGQIYDEKQVSVFLERLESQVDSLLGEDPGNIDGKGRNRWKKRCNALRIQNSELENERARLAQVRVQLQIRVQESGGKRESTL